MKMLSMHRVFSIVPFCLCAVAGFPGSAECDVIHVTDAGDSYRLPQPGSLRHALKYLAHAGDLIVFDQPFTVILDGPLDIPPDLSGLTIKGPGAIRGTDLFHLSISADNVTIDHVAEDNCRVIVEDKVDGATITGSLFTGSFSGIQLNQGATNTIIGGAGDKGNTFQFNAQTAITSYMASGTQILGNTFTDRGAAISAKTDPRITVKDNFMSGGSLIFLDGCGGQVQNNRLTLDNAILGIWAIGCRGDAGSGLAITGNSIAIQAPSSFGGAGGIDIEGSGVTITGNTLIGTGMTGSGILLGYGGDGYSATGMVNIGQNSVRGFNTGIAFVAGKDKIPQATVTGNTVSNCRMNGLFVNYQALSGTALISSNNISFIGSAKRSGTGIYIRNGRDGLAFDGNSITNVFGAGTSIDTLLGKILLRLNYIAYCRSISGHGVQIGPNAGSGTVQAQKNTIEHNEGNGYQVQGGRLESTEDIVRYNVGAGLRNAARALVSRTAMDCNQAGGIDNSGCSCGAQAPSDVCIDPQSGNITGRSVPNAMIDIYGAGECSTPGQPGYSQGALYLAGGVADGSGAFTCYVSAIMGLQINTGKFLCTASDPIEDWTSDFIGITCRKPQPGEQQVLTPVEVALAKTASGLKEFINVEGGLSVFNEHCLYIHKFSRGIPNSDRYERRYCAPDGRSIVRVSIAYCRSGVGYHLWEIDGYYILLDDGSVVYLEYLPSQTPDFAPPVARGSIGKSSPYDYYIDMKGDALYSITQTSASVSRDSGKTWQDDVAGIPAGNINYGIAVDTNQVAWLAHATGLYRQDPDSSIWRNVGGWPQPSCTAIHADRRNRLYAANFANVYYSTDNGVSWILNTSGLASQQMTGFFSDAFGNVYAWNAHRIYRSTGGTQSWTRIDQSITSRSFEQSDFTPMISDLVADSSILCTTAFGLFESTDFGATWTEYNTGLNAEITYGYVIRQNGSELVSTHLGIFRRDSASGAWSKTFPPSGYMANCPLFQDNAGNLYTVAERLDPSVNNSVRKNWKSTDGGLTWFDDSGGISSLATGQGQVYFVDETGVQHYAAFDFPRQINRKIPGGSWEADMSGYAPVSTDQPTVFGSDRRGAIYLSMKHLLGPGGTLLRKASAGGSWSSDTLGLNGAPVYSFTVDRNGAMWAGTYGAGLFKRIGSTWTPIPLPGGIASNSIYTLTADSSGAVIAAFSFTSDVSYTGRGIFMTTDDGQSWKSLGLDTLIVRELCTFGNETYARTDYGIVHLSKQTSGGAPKSPALSISTRSLDFGEVQIGGARTKSFSVGNPGTDTLRVAAIASGNSAFAVVDSIGVIPPGGSAPVRLRFAPEMCGSAAAAVLLVSNALTSPDTLPASGFGKGTPVASLMTRSIGLSAPPYQAVDSAFSAGNIGSDTLRIGSVRSTDARMSVSPATMTLAPYEAGDVHLHLPGLPEGTYAALCILTENASPAADTVAVLLTVSAPRRLQFSSALLDFGNVRVGSAKDLHFVIRNISSDSIGIGRIDASNAAFAASPSSALLAPADSLDVRLRFQPATAGAIDALVRIVDNAQQPIDSLRAAGRGTTGPLFAASQKRLDFGGVEIGRTKSLPVTLSNAGGDTLHVSSVFSTATEFRSLLPSFTLGPSAALDDTLLFMPAASGVRTGFIMFSHDGTPPSDTIFVTGTGETPTSAENSPGTVREFSLERIYPNPISGSMTIRWTMREEGFVSLRLLDLYGREAAFVADGVYSPGGHRIAYAPANIPPGIYFVMCRAGGETRAQRIVLLK